MRSPKDEERAKELISDINCKLDELKRLMGYLSNVNGYNYKIRFENNEIVVEVERIEYFI